MTLPNSWMPPASPQDREPLTADGPGGWPLLRLTVFNRDMGCIVPYVDPDNDRPCKGMPTLDHVPERGRNGLGMKAPDDEAHLVTVCTYHHTGQLWPERHRDLERAYLARWWPQYHGSETDGA